MNSYEENITQTRSLRNKTLTIVDTTNSFYKSKSFQAQIIDFIKAKPTIAVILVTKDRITTEDKDIIKQLPDLHDNLLVVFINDGVNFTNNENFSVTPFNSCLNKLCDEKQSADLLAWINNRTVLNTKHFKEPIWLFNQSANESFMNIRNETIRVNITHFEKSSTERFIFYDKLNPDDSWFGYFADIFGNGINEYVAHEINYTVKKNYIRYDEIHVQSATRFDNKLAVFDKQYKGPYEYEQIHWISKLITNVHTGINNLVYKYFLK